VENLSLDNFKRFEVANVHLQVSEPSTPGTRHQASGWLLCPGSFAC
jgi:hypothetical protein